MRSLSSQSEKIYKLLLENNSLTAKQIGKELKIFPHAVYRATKPLINLGMIKKKNNRPEIYEANSVVKGLEEFLDNQRESFLKSFGFYTNLTQIDSRAALDLHFIKTRGDLLDKTNSDIYEAKKEIYLIVSGLEVPAETILAFKNANGRGLKIRIIVQKLDETNDKMLQNWKKLGIQVRYYPVLETRLFIFDNKIVYLTSYNPDQKEEALGVRFNYRPIARIVRDFFDQRWVKAEEIK